MAALGLAMARAGAARRAAAAHRAAARDTMPCAGVAEMAAQSAWQAAEERRARLAEVEAARAETQAAPLRAALARTLGRENVAAGLIERARADAARLAERRAEGMAPTARGRCRGG